MCELPVVQTPRDDDASAPKQNLTRYRGRHIYLPACIRAIGKTTNTNLRAPDPSSVVVIELRSIIDSTILKMKGDDEKERGSGHGGKHVAARSFPLTLRHHLVMISPLIKQARTG
jgi:hypothetical protein